MAPQTTAFRGGAASAAFSALFAIVACTSHSSPDAAAGTGGVPAQSPDAGTGAITTPACSVASDCGLPESECRSNACQEGKCGYAFAPSGTALSQQQAGDCKQLLCSGTGSEVSGSDATDSYDDGNDCTLDSCGADSPLNTPLAAGTACGPTGQGKCDGAGTCGECVADTDCPGELCVTNLCVPRSCADGKKGGTETDVDCGGSECQTCEEGKACSLASDCQTGVCGNGVCQPGQCEDNIENGTETDIDCGGVECPGCGPLQGCKTHSDCAGNSCSGSVCISNCFDGVENNGETGVDCGGPDCSACGVDPSSTAVGCQGVFNPGQILDYKLTMSAGDWSALKADLTNSQFFPAALSCNDGPPLAQVGVRRKRSGGTSKPGMKVDINYYVDGQSYYGLKKLSLENGISEGSGDVDVSDLLTEYLSWRIVQVSGTMGSRAAFARVYVNGALLGVYVNVEQVDKAFLRSRLGDDSGWLYKKSGSASDGYKTNETQPNPYAEYFCFWQKQPCPVPTNLESYLPTYLDIEQMLRFGGINAISANSDAPFVKDNNYIFYDYGGGPRLYFPWDLDTTHKDNPTILTAPGTTMYTDVLFTHWKDDYDILLTSILRGPLALTVIHREIDQAVSVAGAALDSDPYITGSSAADSAAQIKAYWSDRHPQLVAELDGHLP